MPEKTKVKAEVKRKKITVGQLIALVISLAIMIFVVFQTTIMVKYTLGKDVNPNHLWLYKLVVESKGE